MIERLKYLASLPKPTFRIAAVDVIVHNITYMNFKNITSYIYPSAAWVYTTKWHCHWKWPTFNPTFNLQSHNCRLFLSIRISGLAGIQTLVGPGSHKNQFLARGPQNQMSFVLCPPVVAGHCGIGLTVAAQCHQLSYWDRTRNAHHDPGVVWTV